VAPVQSIENRKNSHSCPRDKTADLPHTPPTLFVASFLPHRARSCLPDNSPSSWPTSYAAKSSRCLQTQRCYPTGWIDWEWNEQHQRGARYREVSKVGCSIPHLPRSEPLSPRGCFKQELEKCLFHKDDVGWNMWE
jgi:hypothetical protein